MAKKVKKADAAEKRANGEPEAGSVLPRQGFYGICGWDCIVKGYPIIHFATKRKATKWMADHGFQVI